MKRATCLWASLLASAIGGDWAAAQSLRQPHSILPESHTAQPVIVRPVSHGTVTQRAVTAPSERRLVHMVSAECGCAPIASANGAGGCTAGGCVADSCGCGVASGCGACDTGCGGRILGNGTLGCLLSPCCELGDPISLFPETCCGIKAGGWIQGGWHDASDGLFNTTPDEYNIHQLWLYAEKDAEGGKEYWTSGFRMDVLYGIDANNTQAFGNNPGEWDFLNGWDHGIYGWAMPQLYVELARGDLSVIAGHFFTPVGYEVVPATGNFFYSHAFTMNNSEPFTHTGVLSTYNVSENLAVYAGWTLGWDTGFDQLNGGNSWLGGFKASLTDNLSFTYVSTAGNLGLRGIGYSHSMVFNLNITDKWNYVFHSDLVSTDAQTDNDQFSINQYLFYAFSDCVKYGTRMEWWKDDGISTYELTGGLNIWPHANFVIRPELRHQWTPGLNVDETIAAFDTILTY